MCFKRFNIKISIYLFLFIFLYSLLSVIKAEDVNIISKKLYLSKQAVGNYEINEIQFKGNSYFTSNELKDYISSQASDLSLPHRILLTLHKQTKINNAIPAKVLLPRLGMAIKLFSKEYKFFNEEIAFLDVDILKNLYHINGFHFVKIHFEFIPDTILCKNLLIFYIEENDRYKISSIEYKGLEELPEKVKNRVNQNMKIKKGDYFSEQIIENEMNAINSRLLNNGYMYTKWDYPNVIMDTISKTDSIIGYFDVGKRIKFGEIIFVDSTNNQKKVANSTKEKLILFKPNDFYAKFRIDRSIEYLLSMGTFESVSIDTLKREYGADEEVRDFVITCNYMKLKEWDVGLFVDQTQIDNLVNAGINGSIKHRNLFGSAQNVQLFTDFSFKDLNHFLSTFRFPNYEFRVGCSYTQPLLWKLNTSRIALSTSFVYSIETISDLFKIATISIPIKIPIKLSHLAYFSNMQIDINFDRENPFNFNKVLTYALDSAKTQQDTNNILRAFTLYGNIYNYLNEPETHLFTSNILSLSLTEDRRNHPFSPTRGHFSYIGIDGLNIFLSHPTISGSAKYFRGQIIHNHYFEMSPFTVLATKSKLGLTYLMDEANSFVPLDRQFFSGGANSVRAWRARALRYYNINSLDEFNDENAKEYAIDYIGSRTLIEGSLELRRNLSDLSFGENLQGIINNIWMTLFFDVGNSFGWYYEDGNENAVNIKFSDYITKLAVATGFGIRYETPVGPIRVDIAFPVYDPMKQRKAFSDCIVHFGIGHAF